MAAKMHQALKNVAKSLIRELPAKPILKAGFTMMQQVSVVKLALAVANLRVLKLKQNVLNVIATG